MKANHTPGPWEIDLFQCVDYEIIISAGGSCVASAHHDDPCEPTEIEKANARLIAAAPDLLWFAQRAADCLTIRLSYGDIGNCSRDSLTNLKNDALAIIKKVRGE